MHNHACVEVSSASGLCAAKGQGDSTATCADLDAEDAVIDWNTWLPVKRLGEAIVEAHKQRDCEWENGFWCSSCHKNS